MNDLARRLIIVALTILLAGPLANQLCAAEGRPKKIVLIAGKIGSHPPGTHEYEKSCQLLKHYLDSAPNVEGIKTEVHLLGWPQDPKTLDDADTIVLISDGSDRDEQDHPLLVGNRLAVIEKQMQRGCGLVAIHWTTFFPNRHGDKFLEWIGGYFDYESGTAANKWCSKCQTHTTTPKPASPNHPICRGIEAFELREEYYFNIRFRDKDPRLVPILSTPIPGEPGDQVVAWAVERKDSGRGFGFTGGHFFENWSVPNFRRLVLNAILWTAKAEVPAGGVKAPSDDDRPINALIVTGHQHPAHDWKEVTKALEESLAPDARFKTTVTTDPEFLATDAFAGFQVVVLNYCNWERPGLTAASKQKLQQYVDSGGGLAIIHFANGAFHASLPNAADSDWPEYHKLCRRVWDHTNKQCGHDAYGKFQVEITSREHPITHGLASFETTDELYFGQQGDLPIEVLATARSKVTGKDEPMAFAYQYGKGRVFQTVLGHAAESVRTPGTADLVRRGCIWAAARPQRDEQPASALHGTVRPNANNGDGPKLAEGRFAQALDPSVGQITAASKPEYQQAPLTVECWAKLKDKTGFNILVASSPKESSTHWEVYSYAGSGEFSAYLPGFSPAEIKSGVNIVDDQWHYVAMVREPDHVRLLIDGKQATDVAIKPVGGTPQPGPLWFGAYPPQAIRCAGLVDEVRVSKVAREIKNLPAQPLADDEQTIGLWHFDQATGPLIDSSPIKNHATFEPSSGNTGVGPSASGGLDYRGEDPGLQAILLDRSPTESFLSLRTDMAGRIFVGGREALFVYEPDSHGGYQPRRELYRFPPHSWITDIEIRGNDLYVMTASAIYLLPEARLRREAIQPRRLIWGMPVDLHVTLHGLAWGPEGDLYFVTGDPLLNYGDFGRPDHWGHWTIFSQPEGTKTPYTGAGGVLRCRPDGSGLQVVARGTRGSDGLCFDAAWNLFTNDNDHESLAAQYSPARLLHVTPHADFAWPRGWMPSKTPDRSDLLEIVCSDMTRGVPVGQAYYDDALLSAIRGNLLVARWDLHAVTHYPLRPRGASFESGEQLLLTGRGDARPVGVCGGRGGRVFAAISYMQGNEGSPTYASDLVMLAPAEESPAHPFHAYDAPSATADALWQELSHGDWSRRRTAHEEILRRGGALLADAASRLSKATPADPAMRHLIWLAAAGGAPQANEQLIKLVAHAVPAIRLQAIRALSEFPHLRADQDLFTRALADSDPQVQLAAVHVLFRFDGELPAALIAGPARSNDSYLRQASAVLLGERSDADQLARLCASDDKPTRLAGVLAAGFRLTIPPATRPIPDDLVHDYPHDNALFVVPYADAQIDLRTVGRVGSVTTAEWWQRGGQSADERKLFELLMKMLDDREDQVRLQAAHFLYLLKDSTADPLVAKVRETSGAQRLALTPRKVIDKAWLVGPFQDIGEGFHKQHPPETGAIDLAAEYVDGDRKLAWQDFNATDGRFDLRGLGPAPKECSSYLYFRLQSRVAQQALLSWEVPNADSPIEVWHIGRKISGLKPWLLNLDPGSNDILVRFRRSGWAMTIGVRALDDVQPMLPEKLGLGTLAERLKSGGDTAQIPPEFANVDWQRAAGDGDPARGRKLFSADALGCVKCHAITPEQTGGGAPSLAGAARRFTVPHLVESILLPSKQVAPVFRASTLTTDDGQILSGLILREDADVVELLLPDGTRKSIAKATIDQRRLQELSPMPGGLVKTPAELRDLLAYLLSENPEAP